MPYRYDNDFFGSGEADDRVDITCLQGELGPAGLVGQDMTGESDHGGSTPGAVALVAQSVLVPHLHRWTN